MDGDTKPDILGLAEVAEIAGVSKQVVSNWRKRRKTFPIPYTELKMGPIWYNQRGEIEEWIKQYKKT